jgi:hypothetical protein
MSEFLLGLATPAVLGVLVTGSLLAVFNDWRLGFAALAAQYVFAAALAGQIVVWQVVSVKLLVGLLVVLILTLTGWQVNFGRRAALGEGGHEEDGPPAADLAGAHALARRIEFPTNFPFRVIATLMVVVAAWATATQPGFAMPGLSLGLNVACFLLISLGLLNLGLTEEPMNAGLGLLTLLTGFELLYAAVEPSLAVVGLLAAVNFAVALAASYLALVRFSAAGRETQP